MSQEVVPNSTPEQTEEQKPVPSTSPEAPDATKSKRPTLSELEMRVLMILEDIFSYEKTVSLLVPSMNSQLFVPISEVLKIEPLKYMTQDAELIARLLKKSERIIVSEDGKSIRPNVPVPQRTTLILRDIPTSTPEEEVRALFDLTKIGGQITKIKAEIQNNWYVTFDTEATAMKALQEIRTDKPVSAHLKSESLMRGMSGSGYTPRQFYSGGLQPPPGAPGDTGFSAQSLQQGGTSTGPFRPSGPRQGSFTRRPGAAARNAPAGDRSQQKRPTNSRFVATGFAVHAPHTSTSPSADGKPAPEGASGAVSTAPADHAGRRVPPGAPARKQAPRGGSGGRRPEAAGKPVSAAVALGQASFPPLPPRSGYKKCLWKAFKGYTKSEIIDIVSAMQLPEELAMPESLRSVDLGPHAGIILALPNTTIEITKPLPPRIDTRRDSSAMSSPSQRPAADPSVPAGTRPHNKAAAQAPAAPAASAHAAPTAGPASTSGPTRPPASPATGPAAAPPPALALAATTPTTAPAAPAAPTATTAAGKALSSATLDAAQATGTSGASAPDEKARLAAKFSYAAVAKRSSPMLPTRALPNNSNKEAPGSAPGSPSAPAPAAPAPHPDPTPTPAAVVPAPVPSEPTSEPAAVTGAPAS